MLPELDGDFSDWRYVFDVACRDEIDPAIPGDTVSCAAFDRGDVKTIIGMAEGDNDGPDWVLCAELHDGRFVAMRAGCDYTGWG